MRKILILLFISISTLISAQNQIGINLGYGIPYYKIDISESNQNNNMDISYKTNQAYNISLVYKKLWPGLVSFGSSISYQFHSIHVNESSQYKTSSIITDADYKLNYINIKAFPEFAYGDKFRFYFQVGPSLAILFDSSVDGYTDIITPLVTGGESKIRNILSGDASGTFNMFSFGFFGGMGIDFPISDKIVLSSSIKYQHSINSWFEQYENTYSDRSLFFNIGCSYKITEVQ